MSGSLTGIILIPIVVILVLVVWLGAVYRAQRHPRGGEAAAPLSHEVTGGGFQASGGRQVTPRRDATPPEAEDYEDTNYPAASDDDQQ